MHTDILASTARRWASAALEATLVIAIGIALVFAGAVVTRGDPAGADTALAKGGSSLWIAGATSRSPQLTFGQVMAFGYKSTSASSIQLHCYQPAGTGRLVFADSQMLSGDASGLSDPFELGPSAAWTSGAATCKGMLGHRSNSGKYIVEDSVTFDVAP
ncbi:MAG TPA: hypothetical protein VGM51_06910 [Armatimonadota bacterium]|jgi:hypothetical protein